jgi:hypothetical protein
VIGDLLKPPTDNLYKFMCICGLILFLISSTYPPWLVHRTTLASYEAERDSQLLDLDLAESKRRSKAFQDEIAKEDEENLAIDAKLESAQERFNSKQLSRSERESILAELQRMKTALSERRKKRTELLNAFTELAANIQAKNVELHYKTRVILWEIWYGRVAIILCLLGCALGLMLGRKGFNLWSLRVQVYQDAILKKQAGVGGEENEKGGAT